MQGCVHARAWRWQVKAPLIDALIELGVVPDATDDRVVNADAEKTASVLADAAERLCKLPAHMETPVGAAAVRLCERIAAADEDAARELVAVWRTGRDARIEQAKAITV